MDGAIHPTSEELSNLSLAATKLWELDVNRLKPGRDYEIDLQRGKSSYQEGDCAPNPLFKRVNEDVFQKPTFAAFLALLDNYERETGVSETITREEKKENWDFINLCYDTPCMQYCHNYCKAHNKAPEDPQAFRRELYKIWFNLYRREAQNDSSGFEHVFVGEERNGQVIGFHNWMQILNEERAGRVDYKGYIRPKRRGRAHDEPHDFEQLVTIQFAWEGVLKPVGSSFIGTSPEFELALYTMAFLAGKEQNRLTVGPYHVLLKCFRIGHGGRVNIGTSYPEALPMNEHEAATKVQGIFRGRNTRKSVRGNRK